MIIVDIEEGAFAGPGFGPGINRPAGGRGGGPQDVFAFLLWIATRPKRRRRSRIVDLLSRDQQRILKLLRGLDAARTLQLARANAAIFTSA